MHFPLVRQLGWWFTVLLLLFVGAAIGAFVTCYVRIQVGPGESKPTLENMTAFIAALALAAAFATYRFGAVKSKRDLFVSLHESLIAPDVQKGRWILNNAKSYTEVDGIHGSDRDSVNRSLALYETLAMYTLNGNVYRSEVLQAWGWTIWNTRQKIQWFIAAREESDHYRSWPNLRKLLDEMKKKPPKKP